jgi:hypothetical protein
MKATVMSSIFLVIAMASFFLYTAILVYCNSVLEKKDRCSFLNSYPYQFYSNYKPSARIALYVILGINVLSLAVGESFFLVSLKSTYAMILAVAFPLAIICLGISNILPLNQYKAHIALASVSFFSFAFASILFSFITVIASGLLDPLSISLPITIVIGVFGFLGFLSMFNSKLFSWFKMDKAEENGKVIYVKPKVNWFAFYEWIFFVMENLTGIIFFINIMVTGTY